MGKLKVLLTPLQFDALAEISSMHQSPTAAAVRDVLVGGMRATDAAKLHGISRQGIHNRLTVLRKYIRLAHIIANDKIESKAAD